MLQVGGQRKTVAAGQPAVRDLGLRPDEDVPPPDVVQVVVWPRLLQAVVVGQSVVGPPHPAGHPVSHQTVDGVVTSAQQQHHHARHGQTERRRVNQHELLSAGGIWTRQIIIVSFRAPLLTFSYNKESHHQHLQYS